jgi:hypothetical protein
MSQHFFYCSELSRQATERVYATASIGGLWLLLEYAQGWEPRAFQESHLSPAVKTFLSTVPRARLLLIKRDRKRQERLSFFVVRSRESDPFIVKFELDDYEQLLNIDIASAAAGRPSAGGVVSKSPLFLVCTHGKRDKCCAKFGYPLYKSLREYGDDAAAAVWQSSHVGGDRFAANLICFPHGLFYAHVNEEAGHKILREYAAERRRLVLEKYRGRTCYSYPVQAAEYFIRSESKITGLDGLRHLTHERLDENAWRVRFLATDTERVYEARVTGVFSEFHNYITCHSTEKRRVIQYLLDDYQVVDDRLLVSA